MVEILLIAIKLISLLGFLLSRNGMSLHLFRYLIFLCCVIFDMQGLELFQDIWYILEYSYNRSFVVGIGL